MTKQIITKKQQTILILIYTFRFLNSKQIQQLLQHTDHRRSNAWLKDLVAKEYIYRNFTPGIGAKPAVYHLSPKGKAYLKETYLYVSETYLKRLVDDKNRSKGYQIKCQLVADFYLISFPNQEKLQHSLSQLLSSSLFLPAHTFRFLTPGLYLDYEHCLLERLKPDAYFFQRKKNGSIQALLFVIDSYSSRLMLTYLLRRIFATLEEEYWEENVAELHIYLLCPSHAVRIYLTRRLKTLLETYTNTSLSFHLATRNQLYLRQKENRDTTGWITLSSEDF